MAEHTVTLAERHDRSDGETVLRLHLRDENNEYNYVDVEDTHPYFYITNDEAKLSNLEETLAHEREVLSIETDAATSVNDHDLTKITTRNSSSVPTLSEPFETAHANNVLYHHRWRIDLGIETGVEVPTEAVAAGSVGREEVEPATGNGERRVCTLDIEVSDQKGFPEPKDAASRVLSIVAHDSYSDSYSMWALVDDHDTEELQFEEVDEDNTFIFTSEKELLQHFATMVSAADFDVLTGWNFEQFDAPYLVNRMRNLNVDTDLLARQDGSCYTNYNPRRDSYRVRMDGREVVDMLQAYKKSKFTEQDSYSLDNTAKRELGAEKLQFSGSYWEFHQRDLQTFLDYNIRDVELTVRLNKELDIFGFMDNLQQEVGCEFGDTMYAKDMVPFAVRKLLHEKGKVPPSSAGNKRDYEGAHVFEPTAGVHGNVVGIDLASLYPATIRMANLSPETKDPDGEIDGIVSRFGDAPVGVIPELCEKYLSLKSELKQRKRSLPEGEEKEAVEERYNVTKVVVNSIYGIVGYKPFFMYDADVAEACTLLGQSVIQRTAEYIKNDTVGTVIAGDTDSTYISFPDSWTPEQCRDEAEQIADTLNSEVYPALAEEHGIPRDECRWVMEPEDYIASFFTAGKKKRYAYRATAEWTPDGWRSHEDSFTIKGFEYKRSDVAPITKRVQEDVLKMVLKNESMDKVRKRVRDAAQEVPTADWGHIGRPRGIGKQVPHNPEEGAKDNYYAWSTNKDAPQDPHPRGVYNAEVLGLNGQSMGKPLRIYLNPARSNGMDVVCFEDPQDIEPYREDLTLDIQETVRTTVRDPVAPILEAVGLNVDATMAGQQQTGIGDFA